MSLDKWKRLINRVLILSIAILIAVGSTATSNYFQHQEDQKAHLNEYKGLAISIGKLTSNNSIAMHSSDTEKIVPVILTNTSDQPLILFEDWNSWGYDNLSFEITDQTGNIYKVTKEPTCFLANYPSYFTIEPQSSFIINVIYGEGIWENFPVVEKGRKNKIISIRAIYINMNPDKYDAWVGRIISKPYQYTLYQ